MKKKDCLPLNEAQRMLVADHYKVARLVASRLIRVLAAANIQFEDAVSIAWIGMCEAASEYSEKHGSPSTYFYLVCRSAILHEVRKANMHKRKANINTVSLDEPVTFSDGDSISSDGATYKAHRGDDATEAMRKADPAVIYEMKEELGIRLSVLPDRDRRIFLLDHAGWKQREIAAMFGITGGGVSGAVVRSRARCREVAC